MNAALAADAQHITVRPLSNRDVRSEESQVEIVAPIVRKGAHYFGGEVRRFRRERGIDRRDLGDDGDARELRGRAREDKREINCLAERHRDIGFRRRRVADGSRRDVVSAEWQEGSHEHAGVAGFDRARVIRFGVADRDEGGDGFAARVCGNAAYYAGGRLRLRVKESRDERDGREEKKESQRS